MTVDAALLKLATGVSRGILKLWLKDRPVLESTAGSMLDLFALKTGNVLAQRSGERQMQQIADRIYENLFDLVRIEFPGILENSRVAITLAADETLARASFTTLDVLRLDMEPSDFCVLLCNFHPQATLHFSLAERELYIRLMQQASQYILDITRQLPFFTVTTLEEILRRETSLVGKADELIREVRRIGRNINDPKTIASRFEGDYLRAVGRHLDHLELFGIDVSSSSKRYRLSVAYVSLSFECSEICPGSGTDSSDEIETFTPVQALTKYKRFVIRGPAGSGKTTFLQWVAVQCAARNMPEELDHLNEKVPFLIPLRKIVGATVPPMPEQFPGLVVPLVANEMPHGWVHQILRDGRGIVLVDGLDELSEFIRRQILQWIVDFSEEFPTTTIIVTTRPHALESSALEQYGFTGLRIQDMTRNDISEFVIHWHSAVAEALSEVSATNDLTKRRDELLSSIRNHGALSRLATSPLLCALLCALNRERISNLPSDRVELYRICVDMFLRRDVERHISLSDYIELVDRQKLSLLEDLAYWMLRNGKSEISADECRLRFRIKLDSMSVNLHEPNALVGPGERVRRLFVERSGVLRQPGRDRVDFPHRSFQEYLAAADALAHNDIGFLIAHAHDAHWREVVVLAAGRARQNESEEIIKGILARADSEIENSVGLIFLAASCATIAMGVKPFLTHLIQSRIAHYLPPLGMREVSLLASAGEMVLSYLEYRNPPTAVRSVLLCIRTIVTIGGPNAVGVLAGYAQDGRQAVVQELIRIAPMFSPDERYPQRVLAHSTSAKLRLNSVNISTLELIALFPKLCELKLEQSISSLAPLANFLQLVRLNVLIHFPAESDSHCAYIQGIKGLEELQLAVTAKRPLDSSCGTKPFDVGSLCEFSQLKVLSLNGSGCRFQKLQNLPKSLEILDLRSHGSEGNSASDFVEAASRLPRLKEFRFTALTRFGVLQDFDLGELRFLTKLESISFAAMVPLQESIAVLFTFPKLRRIEILDWIDGYDVFEHPWFAELLNVNFDWTVAVEAGTLLIRKRGD